MDPSLNLSPSALQVLGGHVNSLAGALLEEAIKLTSYNNNEILSSREIQIAVRLRLPGELAKHSVSEGTKAVTKYSSSGNSGLVFSVGRVLAEVEAAASAAGLSGVEANPAVYLAAVLEYVCAEVLHLARDQARGPDRPSITVATIAGAIESDPDLARLFGS